MVMKPTQRRATARVLAARMFRDQTATMNLDDLTEAIGVVDDVMDRVINTIPSAWGSLTVKEALARALPEPFASKATGAQKAMVVALWAMKEGKVL